MRAYLSVQMAKAKAQSVATWSGSEPVLRCSAARKNTELCGDDHVPVTRGRMRAQYPLPHAPPPAPCISYALVQATVGVGTVLLWYRILIQYQM